MSTALVLGVESVMTVSIPGQNFPAEATFKTHVRGRTVDGPIVAELSTADGSIVRVNATTLEFKFRAAVTRNWFDTRVVFDALRTDLTPDQHLGFITTVDFIRPATFPEDA